MQGLAHPDGEAATARACRKTGVVMGLSSFSTTSLEDVARENGDNPRVLQYTAAGLLLAVIYRG